MNDDVLIELSRSIGRLEGSVQAMATNQKETNEHLIKLLDSHAANTLENDKRITVLENLKFKLIGVCAGFGAAGSVATIVIARIFKILN